MKPGTHQATAGYVLVSVLALGVLLILMVSISSNVALNAAQTTATESRKSQSFYAAQSGVERVLAKLKALKASSLPASLYTNAQVAEWLKPEINGMSGNLSGGARFTVTAAVVAATGSGNPPAALEIYSQGYSSGDVSHRRIKITYPVVLSTLVTQTPLRTTLLTGAPAALTTTGSSSIGGSAPVAGDNAAPGTTYNFNCPVAYVAGLTCNRSTQDPDAYVLHYAGGAIPSGFTIGQALRPTQLAAGQTSEERYIVNAINSATGDVTLKVLSDYIRNATGPATRRTFSATGTIPMQQLNSVPAVIMPASANVSAISQNVRDVCPIYGCDHYTMDPENLFSMIMGGTKAEVKARFQAINTTVPGSYTTSSSAPCNPTSQWMVPSSLSVTLGNCTNPRLVIVDARGLSGTSLSVDMPPQTTFRGLLYILTDKPTDPRQAVGVKIASNMGFTGAMLVDNGLGGIDMTGNANFNTDCTDTQVEDGLKATPKLCFDPAILTTLNQSYQTTVWTTTTTTYAIDQTGTTQSSWAEVGE